MDLMRDQTFNSLSQVFPSQVFLIWTCFELPVLPVFLDIKITAL